MAMKKNPFSPLRGISLSVNLSIIHVAKQRLKIGMWLWPEKLA